MALIVAGISHRTSPIEARERFAHTIAEVAPALQALRERTGASEMATLSTCNRTEFYAVEGENEAISAILEHLSTRLGEDASSHVVVRRDRDAVTHLFRVASGLDSMIVGEAQIHGQVRDAWETSRAHSGVVLNRLFQSALLVGGRVRSETGIGRGAASVSSAAVQLAKKIFGSLTGRSAMVLGAGEMAELALECLVDEGVRAAIVANRTHVRAEELAARHGARAMAYEQCWAELATVDLLVCSTSAPHAIVERAHVEPAMQARGGRPLCILDIALPRDVDPDVRELNNVFLYDLDDLRAVVAASIEQRRGELPSAESVVADETERYWQWLTGLAAVPVLTSFRSEMDQLRERELVQHMRRFAHLPEQDRAAIEHFSRALMNKFLHEPTVRLRAAAANGRGLGIVDAVRYLFALPDAPAAPPSDTETKENEPSSPSTDKS